MRRLARHARPESLACRVVPRADDERAGNQQDERGHYLQHRMTRSPFTTGGSP